MLPQWQGNGKATTQSPLRNRRSVGETPTKGSPIVMSTEIAIPGGKVYFREKQTGRGKKLLRAAGISVATNLSEYPELLEPPREGESPEARAERIDALRVRLTPQQAEFLDNIREATVLALLESWTLDKPLPRTVDELESLDEDLYDALLDSVMEIPGAKEDTDFQVVPVSEANKDRPTSGSSDSDGPSDSSAMPGESTTTPGSTGSPTNGDSSIQEP